MSFQHVIGADNKTKLVFFCGISVFLVAVFGASVDNVASAVTGIFFVGCLFFISKLKSAWSVLSKNERVVVMFFIIYTASCVISYINVTNTEDYLKQLSRYTRFTLFVLIYLIFRLYNINVTKYFYSGVVASGPVFLMVALNSINSNPDMPATGMYHHIIFGDIALLNAMIMIAALMTMKLSPAVKVIIVISMLCALYACALSLTRGAWIALPMCLVVLITYGIKSKVIDYRAVFAFMFVTVAAAAVAPDKDVYIDKAVQAVEEARMFMTGERYSSSVGSRLGMWKIATDVWLRHPVIGTGPGDYKIELLDAVEKGEYKSYEIHGHAHNIYFQALAVTGLLGFVILMLAIIILPGKLFFDALTESVTFESLAGILVIISFSIFGLTGDWASRSPMIAIYMTYFLSCSTGLYYQKKNNGS